MSSSRIQATRISPLNPAAEISGSGGRQTRCQSGGLEEGCSRCSIRIYRSSFGSQSTPSAAPLHAPIENESERDVVVLGLAAVAAACGAAALVVGRSAAVRCCAAAPATAHLVAALAEHLEVVTDDLGLVLLLAALAVFPGAGLEAAFEIDLLALLEILPGDLGLLPPD